MKRLSTTAAYLLTAALALIAAASQPDERGPLDVGTVAAVQSLVDEADAALGTTSLDELGW